MRIALSNANLTLHSVLPLPVGIFIRYISASSPVLSNTCRWRNALDLCNLVRHTKDFNRASAFSRQAEKSVFNTPSRLLPVQKDAVSRESASVRQENAYLVIKANLSTSRSTSRSQSCIRNCANCRISGCIMGSSVL